MLHLTGAGSMQDVSVFSHPCFSVLCGRMLHRPPILSNYSVTCIPNVRLFAFFVFWQAFFGSFFDVFFHPFSFIRFRVRVAGFVWGVTGPSRTQLHPTRIITSDPFFRSLFQFLEGFQLHKTPFSHFSFFPVSPLRIRTRPACKNDPFAVAKGSADHRQTSRNRGLFLIIQKEKRGRMSNI